MNPIKSNKIARVYHLLMVIMLNLNSKRMPNNLISKRLQAKALFNKRLWKMIRRKGLLRLKLLHHLLIPNLLRPQVKIITLKLEKIQLLEIYRAKDFLNNNNKNNLLIKRRFWVKVILLLPLLL